MMTETSKTRFRALFPQPQIDTMTLLTIQEVNTYLHSRLLFNIGLSIGILLTGGLVSFGISCVFLLSGNKDPETLTQHRLLRAYIIALLFIVTGFVIEEFLRWSELGPYSHSTPSQADRSSRLLTFAINVTPVLVAALTDGLLVWRCYMVQKLVLWYSPKGWKNAFWIFPACLWCLTIVTGFTAAPLLFMLNKRILLYVGTVLQATALFSNVVLNIYATLFITSRLLSHRKLTMKLIGGNADTSRHLYIVSILLESAAINVPITIAAAVGIGLVEFFGAVIAPIAVVGQAFASVIIIHQVAVGRAICRRHEEELGKLAAERKLLGDRTRPIGTHTVSLDV
ncbi:hypothetical protein D9756_008956 [Leucocoprinus leucothites]|uniref:Uncharacterized protein n=1 Tax=Leucocoprinus leucothites TaxID=201217 RepID=A0A8H5CXF2_9AGAR|nr:hypothetical protein D9756_008956 [Leucoagaricus leucothites]